MALMLGMLGTPPWCYFPLTIQYLSTTSYQIAAREWSLLQLSLALNTQLLALEHCGLILMHSITVAQS